MTSTINDSSLSTIEFISAGIALAISIFLSLLLCKVYKLVKPKKNVPIQTLDKKMLYVISILLLSMIFKTIEKVVKGIAKLNPVWNSK